MFIGVDCGTQGTKVVVYDHKSKKIVGEGYQNHQIIASHTGGREQKPAWWIEAFQDAMFQALRDLQSDLSRITGIGISGQQHGAVLLDKNLEVIRDAKLWNDTETADANDAYIRAAGGEAEVIRTIGTQVPVGYTASKLAWMRQYEPEAYQRIAYVLSPKDYLNFYLTGEVVTDIGSASGTGFFDVIAKKWSMDMIKLIDDDGILAGALPELVDESKPVGYIRKEIADTFGLHHHVAVASGSGDNMMTAIGTGNVTAGIATLTLGTSGVFSTYIQETPFDYPKIVQMQNAVNKGWLPTVCTMNAASTINAVKELLNIDLKELDDEMDKGEIGSEGIVFLPFLNGERMPALPHSHGSITGLTIKNCTRANLIRASAEAATFGLRWGRDLLGKKGVAVDQLRINGGGSNSAPWRQIIADVFDSEVIGVSTKEAGAFGGAIQAMSISGIGDIVDICEKHVALDYNKQTKPIKKNTVAYQSAYEAYLETRKRLEGV